MKSHRAAVLIIINLSKPAWAAAGPGESDFQYRDIGRKDGAGMRTFPVMCRGSTFAPSQQIDTSSQVLRMAQFELQGGLLSERTRAKDCI